MKIIMLAGKGLSTCFVYNGLNPDFKIDKVLVTEAPSKKIMLKRRIKKLGYIHVFNQLLFQILAVKILKIFTTKKFEQRKNHLNLDSTPISSKKIIKVGDVNSKQTINTILKLNPDVIIVNGTSIISTKVLDSTNAVFINTHVGITPEYRGVHGGYWALRKNDKNNFGVTVHLVDKGIDTGSILYQDTTNVKKNDNFLIYPLYQYSLAIPLIKKALNDINHKNLKPFKKQNSLSKLYSHPTFTTYILGWVFKGIK